MSQETDTEFITTSNVADYVTVSVSRRVIPGQEENYEEWVSGISKACATFPGYLGVHILRPSGNDNRYTTIYRFDNKQHAENWRNSPEHQEWTSKLADLTVGETKVRSVTGLESWFDLPTISIEKRPIRWRMCLVLTIVVYVMITSLNYLLAPWLSEMDFPFKTLIIVALQVVLMTYLIMPRISLLLKHWLYR